MPDQPADPLHYEMKIPPEPQHPNDDNPSGSGADEKSGTFNSAQEREGDRGSDQHSEGAGGQKG